MTTVTIDIETRAFVKQGSGPIRSAVDVQFTRHVSSASDFSFLMPASDPNAANLANKTSVLRFYFDTTMVLLGVVEAMQRRIGNDGVVWLEVAGRDLMGAEFTEVLAGIDDISGATNTIAPYLIRPDSTNPDGTTTGPDWDIKYYSGGWITYPGGGAPLMTAYVYGKFWGETVLSAYIKIAERTNEQFVYYPETDGDRFVRWIGTRWDDSGVRAIQGAGEPVQAESNDNICFIQSLSKTLESHETITALYAYGSGVGAARLSLAAATSTPTGYTITGASSLIKNNAAVTALGWFTKRLEFKEITPLSNTDLDLQYAANYLGRAAAAWLDRHSSEQTYYDLVVTKLPAAVKPGTQLRVVYADDSLNVDTLFNVISVETRMSRDGTLLYRLQISDTSQWALTGPGVVASTVERGEIYTAHPQMNANSYTTNYRVYVGENTSTQTGEVNVFLGNEIVQINQILVRFKVSALVSTVQSVGSDSPTSGSESSHTHTIPGHVHSITLNNAGSFHANVGLTAPSGTTSFLVNDSGGAIDVNTDTGSGGTTSQSGSSHTHTVTPTITTTYGVYKNTGGNTFAISDLEMDVAGRHTYNMDVTGSGGDSTPLGDGWYEIDITDYMANATTFRPTSDTNTITIKRKAGGSTGTPAYAATVDVLLSVRNVIQAIAYL